MAKANNTVQDKNNDWTPGDDMSGATTAEGSLCINFESVDENAGFSPLPPATYPATIGAMEASVSKANNPMISLTFNITHPDYSNRKLFTHFVLNNDIALGRLKKFMMNVFPDLDLSSVNFTDIIQSGVAIGRPCALKVAQRMYNGSMTNDVKEVLAPQADSFY